LIAVTVRRPAVAAALAAALLGVAACGETLHSGAPESSSVTTTTSPSAAAPGAPGPNAELPAPEALTNVLYKLADPAVPGDQKVGLVEGATPDDAATFDKFGKALADSGYLPLDITAQNIAWATDSPRNVTTDVSLASKNQGGQGFTFPMEFTPTPQGGWQLSRTTASILLTFGQNTPKPTPPR
jgi:hypothetical protein